MNLTVPDVIHFLDESLSLGSVILIAIGIPTAIWLALKFAGLMVQGIRDAVELEDGDKRKNSDKRKNDQVGFDPFTDDDTAPIMTIGDDGELVEVDSQ